jgi:cell shape-determining protein MreC
MSSDVCENIELVDHIQNLIKKHSDTLEEYKKLIQDKEEENIELAQENLDLRKVALIAGELKKLPETEGFEWGVI